MSWSPENSRADADPCRRTDAANGFARRAVWPSSVAPRLQQAHLPFTALGTLSGMLLLGLLFWARVPRSISAGAFWTLHPLHVVLSALVTTAMFRRHAGRGFWSTAVIGYCGAIGVATLSDCLMPLFLFLAG